MELKKIHTIIGIIIGTTVIVGIVWGAIGYLATDSEVEIVQKKVTTVQNVQQLMQERMDLSIYDDRVERSRRDYLMTRQQMIHETRKEPLTSAEKETLRISEGAIKKLVEERKTREEYWKSKK